MSKRLGKGLEALLGSTLKANNTDNNKMEDLETAGQNGLLELSIKQLEPGRYQPRSVMQEEDLRQLAASIQAQGIIQPILVRKKAGDQYEIIAGERRWRAAQLAGLSTVPVVVKKISDEKTLAIALIENIQRENLKPLEEAQALERLSKEFGLTHQQVAEAVGKSRVTVTNLLRLLTLPDKVKQLLEQESLEAGHAKVLLGLKGSVQIQVAQMVAAKALSVRETERVVARLLDTSTSAAAAARSPQPKAKDPDVRQLEMALSEKLGAFVEITQADKGKGRLVIQYNSLEELEGILAHIQ